MQNQGKHAAPRRTRRGGRGTVVAAVLLCVLVLLTVAAAKLRSGAGGAGTPDGAGAGAGASADEVGALLTRLGASITDSMYVGECGEDYAAQLRALAAEEPDRAGQLNFIADHIDIYTEDYVKTALLGGDHIDFALELPFRTPDSSGLDAQVGSGNGAIPYLSQYDERWGYHAYGSSVIGIAGCGPTCLAMAVAGLKGDSSCNPAKVADFASANGYYMAGTGTMWSLFTEGAAAYGLTGEEIPLDENVMNSCIGSGAVIVASMLPGDFTQSGHFVVIYGLGDGCYRVHDPNSAGYSAQTWTYERLSGQIANLWSLSA